MMSYSETEIIGALGALGTANSLSARIQYVQGSSELNTQDVLLMKKSPSLLEDASRLALQADRYKHI